MGRNKKDKGNHRAIPLIVEKSIQYIELHGLNTEGIFRISANKSDFLRIKKMFDKGKSVDFAQENISSHVCAELLKSYFREMAEPLLTLDAHNYFIVLFDQAESLTIAKTKAFLPLLPASNRITLQYLISFLKKVASKSEVNKMTVANLAIVFTPNIIRTVENTSLTTSSLNFVVETMIAHYDTIFQGYDAGNITVKLKRVRSADNLNFLANGLPKEKSKVDTSQALISPRRIDSPSRKSNPLSGNCTVDVQSQLSPQFIASLQKLRTNQKNVKLNTPVNNNLVNNNENQTKNAQVHFDQLSSEWQNTNILKNDKTKYHRELRNNMKNINNTLKLNFNHLEPGELGNENTTKTKRSPREFMTLFSPSSANTADKEKLKSKRQSSSVVPSSVAQCKLPANAIKSLPLNLPPRPPRLLKLPTSDLSNPSPSPSESPSPSKLSTPSTLSSPPDINIPPIEVPTVVDENEAMMMCSTSALPPPVPPRRRHRKTSSVPSCLFSSIDLQSDSSGQN